MSDPQHVAPSAGPRQKEPGCVARLALTSTRPGEGSKVAESEGSASAHRLSCTVNQWMSSSYTLQQQGLSSTGWSRVISVGGATGSPQADAIQRGVLYLGKIAPAVWVMTQHRDPGGCSVSSLPRTNIPRLSSTVSSPLYPPSAGAQGKWLQMEFCAFCHLRNSLSLQLSLSGGQNHYCFSQLYVIWVPFLVVVL